MKIVQINTTCGVGSTGKICVSISKLLSEKGIENYILYSSKTNGYELGIRCSNEIDVKFQALKSKVFGNYGFNSNRATKKMIAELKRIRPEIVHLHNIHGHDCNLNTLCNFLKKEKIKVYWTFHDCWAFTGYCTYFTSAKCNKWLSECKKCVQRKAYSCFFDRSSELFRKKQKLFQDMDLTIITPSQWLANIVNQSFLKDHSVVVINNGIDLDIFHPTESDFKSVYGVENKKLVLGVANCWEARKGIDVFLELSKRLNDDYRIVLVGTDDSIDKELPEKVISIHRTNNQRELAALYSVADVYVNPTREDNYPTVNMEAIACGTPVITFRTGGSPEMIDSTCGSVVECDDIDALENEIRHYCTKGNLYKSSCVEKARNFSEKKKYEECFLQYIS